MRIPKKSSENEWMKILIWRKTTLRIQKAQGIPNSQTGCWKANAGESLQGAKRKWHIRYRGTVIREMADFSS